MSRPNQSMLDRRWPWLSIAAAIVALLVASSMEFHVSTISDPRPLGSLADIERLSERRDLNVLFVLIDTLRADRLGVYGYERNTSPRLDRLASGGVRFAKHLAQSSWTKCSMASLWTGLYPIRNGVTRYDHVLPDKAVLAAEVLKDAGYQTVGLYRNGWVGPTFGFDQGFDVYSRPATRARDPAMRRQNPTVSQRGTDEDTVAAAIEYLRIRGDKRWFVYLHLMDVHEYVYDENSALFGGSYSDIYDNSIRWVDGVIAALLYALEEQGLAARTLVAIAADHGEAFRERGIEGHARAVFRESTEVPLLLSFPFRLEPGIVIESRTQNVDIWPTLFDMLGLDIPPDLDGRSALPEIQGAGRGSALDRKPVQAIALLDQSWGRPNTEARPAVAIADKAIRYVRHHRGGRANELLFDAQGDPHELENIAKSMPDELARLRAAAEAHLSISPLWGAVPRREIEEFELRQLRALGYAVP